jgi:two-component system, sensor histidine kinase
LGLVSEILERWGCLPLCARSQSELLEAARIKRRKPDMLICDYRLAGGHLGIAAVEEIRRAVDRRIPALLITGDTAADRLREAHASGLYLLHKPVAPEHLREVMHALLHEH